MGAVDLRLISLLKELQALPSLAEFVLAGGTNLALRYNHRKSIDIDLILNQIVGKKGIEAITEEIGSLYGESAKLRDYFKKCVSRNYRGLQTPIIF